MCKTHSNPGHLHYKTGAKYYEHSKNKICTKPYRKNARRKLKNGIICISDRKHEGGKFMLRIEDTDQERFMEGALEIIYRTLAKTVWYMMKVRTKTVV